MATNGGRIKCLYYACEKISIRLLLKTVLHSDFTCYVRIKFWKKILYFSQYLGLKSTLFTKRQWHFKITLSDLFKYQQNDSCLIFTRDNWNIKNLLQSFRYLPFVIYEEALNLHLFNSLHWAKKYNFKPRQLIFRRVKINFLYISNF